METLAWTGKVDKLKDPKFEVGGAKHTILRFVSDKQKVFGFATGASIQGLGYNWQYFSQLYDADYLERKAPGKYSLTSKGQGLLDFLNKKYAEGSVKEAWKTVETPKKAPLLTMLSAEQLSAELNCLEKISYPSDEDQTKITDIKALLSDKGYEFPDFESDFIMTASITKEAVIVEENGKWLVKTKDRSKTLGTHDTKEEAEKQLQAIEIHKHADVLDNDDIREEGETPDNHETVINAFQRALSTFKNTYVALKRTSDETGVSVEEVKNICDQRGLL